MSFVVQLICFSIFVDVFFMCQVDFVVVWDVVYVVFGIYDVLSKFLGVIVFGYDDQFVEIEVVVVVVVE